MGKRGKEIFQQFFFIFTFEFLEKKKCGLCTKINISFAEGESL